MRNTLFALGLALAATASAQTPVTTPTKTDHGHDCVMTTSDAGWANLKLNADQSKRVQEIQAACKQECAVAMKDKGTMDRASMEKHEGEIKAVLTAEQYAQWVAYCKDQPVKSDMKMEKSDMRN
ncbi:MAG: hypothetical protein IPG10_07155 [Flavobacteriales bacterium]|nr:hypothetical protein [Flavobacteriales bacterium]MBK6752651.1 hypothetical protein [Flavobacteriales bacterium]MBK7270734.1 hypothetical protein [Flavobacteriales bacterium]MBK7754730.1 hypothetical protein [Flavobacteriales bacterium]MBK9076004.1 hypothetical protein [Flavobacteriales bacterium]